MPKTVDDNHKRTEKLNLCFSPMEMYILDSLCEQFNVSRSDFIRVAMHIADYDYDIFDEALKAADKRGMLTKWRRKNDN